MEKKRFRWIENKEKGGKVMKRVAKRERERDRDLKKKKRPFRTIVERVLVVLPRLSKMPM